MPRYPKYAPSFTVKLNGEPLPTAMRASVTGVRHQDGLEGADRVELSLANPGLAWLDHPLLQVDTGFELQIGYAPDPLETVFVGEITGVNATFPSSGVPTLTVVAHDFLQRLTVGAKDRMFALAIPCIGRFPLPDPLIAELVGATNLLVPVVDPAGAALSFLTLVATYAIDPMEAKRSIRVQENQSDFEFLAGLAKENGWEMFIDHTAEPKGFRLRFRFLIQPDPPDLVLRWGHSLTEFTPRITNVGQVAAVSARIWVAALKLELVVVLGWDYDRAAFDLQVFPGLGSLETVLGLKAKSTLVIDAVGPATVPKKLLSELLPRLNNRLTGSGSAVGDPAIKAGRVVQLDGLGEQFGGLYRVTTSTHTIDGSGYQTTFEVRKEVWFDTATLVKGVAGLARAATGAGARVQGQRIG